MQRFFWGSFLALAALGMSALVLADEIQTTPVEFKQGATVAPIKGVLKGSQRRHYLSQL